MSNSNNEGKLEGWPYSIECGLKVVQGAVVDIYIFKIPCSLSVAMISDQVYTQEDYLQIVQDPNIFKG